MGVREMREIDADKFRRYIHEQLELDDFCVPDEILEMIDEQETVNEWIPCSERLPETDGTFLVTVKSRRKTRVDICNFNKYAKIESHRWGGQYVSMNVIAWKQLPESYK